MTGLEIIADMMIIVLVSISGLLIIAIPIYGQHDPLGVVMVMCRKSKHFKWLITPVFGNGYLTNAYLDFLETRINKFKNSNDQ